MTSETGTTHTQLLLYYFLRSRWINENHNFRWDWRLCVSVYVYVCLRVYRHHLSADQQAWKSNLAGRTSGCISSVLNGHHQGTHTQWAHATVGLWQRLMGVCRPSAVSGGHMLTSFMSQDRTLTGWCLSSSPLRSRGSQAKPGPGPHLVLVL